MFKRGSPFQIPQIPGSRKIIKQDFSEKKKQEQQPYQQSCQNTYKNQLQINSPSSVDQRFCFGLDIPSQSDPTLFWQYDLSPKVTGQYSRKLIFRELQFITRFMSQSQISQTVYIVADQIPGFLNKQGVPTTKVCALHLSQSQTIIDDTGQRAYDLIYKQTQDCSWQIPLNLGNLKFRISFDDQLRSGPLNQSLVCQFDIRHVGK